MENPETREAEAPPYPPPPAPPPATREPMRRRPVLAAFLSVVPGLGNVYNGLYQRGVLLFLLVASLFALAVNGEDRELAFLVPCTVFAWFFNIFDAYRQANLINYGYASTVPAVADRGPFDNLGSWGLIPGVALVALGLYGLLRRFFDIDLGWVLDQWPFAIILFGGWMIYQAMRQRKEAQEMPEARGAGADEEIESKA